MTDIAVRSKPVPASQRRSLLASIAGVLVPYALVGLGLRLLMAYVVFRAGQSKIDGMLLNFNVRGTEFSVVLPLQVKQSTLQLFQTHYASLEVPTKIIAYVFAYAEFLLPICLVLGFVTRFSAMVLLILTVMTVVYVAPAELWTTLHLLDRDSAGAAVGRSGRDLVRRADPVHLPARQDAGIPLSMTPPA